MTLVQILRRIVKELSAGPFDRYESPTEEQQQIDRIPQAYDQTVLMKITSEQAQHTCFYCGRQDHLI